MNILKVQIFPDFSRLSDFSRLLVSRFSGPFCTALLDFFIICLYSSRSCTLPGLSEILQCAVKKQISRHIKAALQIFIDLKTFLNPQKMTKTFNFSKFEKSLYKTFLKGPKNCRALKRKKDIIKSQLPWLSKKFN